MSEDEENELSLEDAENLPEETFAANGQDGVLAYDIPVKVSIVLGNTSMQVRDILYLRRGAVVELDRKVGEPIDIFVNNRLVAHGEVIVVEDRLGLTITEIVKVAKN